MNLGRKLIRLLDAAVDMAVLAVLMLLLAYGCYAVWDSHQLYAAAGSTQYALYKPAGGDAMPLEELHSLNPEAFGWLTVYGTNIDYPLVQGPDNDKYLNTAADGSYSLSGSLFLDYRSHSDFQDFNSIIYGHHMDRQVMFGEIENFQDEDYFDTHRYGALYGSGGEYGLEFVAFLEVDAYDTLYTPGVAGADAQQAYLDHLRASARCWRDFAPQEGQRLVLLSTCTTESTNGRHVLVGRLMDEVPADPFYEEPQQAAATLGIDARATLRERLQRLPLWQACLLLILLILLGACAAGLLHKIRKKHPQGGESV